jgi:hypothetical protein
VNLEPEILVNVSVRLPQTDRAALGEHLSALMAAAVAVGGHTTNISLQPYTPEDDDD